MSEISKSKYGLPDPRFPQGVNLSAEARKARHRLYPVTVLYSGYSLAVLAAALIVGGRPLRALGYYVAGAVAWTYVEYLAHRYILHGFAVGGVKE